MKVLREHAKCHSYDKYDNNPDWFCLNCGMKGSLWTCTEGDYYAGSESFCTNCKHAGHFLDGMDEILEPIDLKIVNQLKTQVTDTPTTPKDW